MTTRTTGRPRSLLLTTLALLVAAGACEDDDATNPDVPGTIVAEAEAAGNFTTLLDVLDQAGLAATLEGPGPFTVFAPTDAAFGAVPSATLQDIVGDDERLTAVLTYHVVEGELDAAAALEAGVVTTLNGQDLMVTESGGTVFVGGVPVVAADVEASNGIIHALGGVLLPSESTLVEIAQASPDFETLVTAVVEAGLADALSAEGPFTVFAPTDGAFADLPAGVLEGLLADPAALGNVLTYHVVSGRLLSPEVVAAGTLTTLQGQTLDVEVGANGTVTVGGAAVTAVDIQGTNGVIHVIDRVLVPGS